MMKTHNSMNQRRYTVRPKTGKPRRQASKGWFRRVLARLFSPRSIIIISEHKTEHVPLSIRKQLVWLSLVLGVVGWGSFSTGNYMAAQETLREKERMIANSHLKNRRIESEFGLLKRDLISMLESENPEDLGEYAQFVVQQYRENGESLDAIDVDLSQLGGTKHGVVFERIAFLEKTVDAMKQEHETVMHAIEETAQNKLKDLKSIIAKTGLKIEQIERKAKEELANSEESQTAQGKANNPSGGPYNPVSEGLLKQYNTPLYDDLKRVVVLNEVVEKLPIAEPMQDYRLTSGYGTRIDPIHKRRAHHSGLDFAGALGAKIFSAADGRVTFAGRKGAYGYMVEVDHGFGMTTRYGHLSKILIEKGQQLRTGQVLGIQGSTGRSTGHHLHYEVRFNGRTMNPKPFIKAGKYVQQKQEESKQTHLQQ